MDREKVIKGLECAIGIRGRKNCDGCPYDNDFNCIGCDIVMRDAIALLKEQKTVLHRQSRKELSSGSTMVTGVYLCPWCKEIISIGFADDDYRFCPYCGRGVKWE